MAEQLYVKRFYLTEIVKAIWDDHPTMGVDHEVAVFTRKYGPFKEETEASSEERKMRDARNVEMKNSGIIGLIEDLGIEFPKLTSESPIPPYEERSNPANDLSFSYNI